MTSINLIEKNSKIKNYKSIDKITIMMRNSLLPLFITLIYILGLNFILLYILKKKMLVDVLQLKSPPFVEIGDLKRLKVRLTKYNDLIGSISIKLMTILWFIISSSIFLVEIVKRTYNRNVLLVGGCWDENGLVESTPLLQELENMSSLS